MQLILIFCHHSSFWSILQHYIRMLVCSCINFCLNIRLGAVWKFCLWYQRFWWNCFCNSKINFSGPVNFNHKTIKCFWFLSVLSEQWPKQAMLCSAFQRNNTNVRLWIVNTDSPKLLTLTPCSQCKIKQLTGMDATWCFWPTAGRCKCAF